MFGLKKMWNGNSIGLPRDVLNKLTTPPIHTPDAAELQSRKHNLVFLYGNEMTGGRANNANVKPLYQDVFTHEPYVMAKVLKGQQVAPVVFQPPQLLASTKSLRLFASDTYQEATTVSRISRLRPAPIKGELYQLTYDEVEQLDKEYQNKVFFDRIRVRIRVEHYFMSKHKVGREEETRMSEVMYHDKRVHMYVARYAPFANLSILNTDELLKERPCNSNYAPRYFYTRQDWE